MAGSGRVISVQLDGARRLGVPRRVGEAWPYRLAAIPARSRESPTPGPQGGVESTAMLSRRGPAVVSQQWLFGVLPGSAAPYLPCRFCWRCSLRFASARPRRACTPTMIGSISIAFSNCVMAAESTPTRARAMPRLR